MSATAAETLTRLLAVAVQQVRHYGAEHQASAESLDGFITAVMGELSRAPAVRFDASGDWLTVQDIALPVEDRYAPQLREHLRQRRAARLALHHGVTPGGLRSLVRLLALDPEELIAEGGLADALRSAGAGGIEVERAAPARAASSDAYQESVAGSAELWTMAERSEPIDLGRAHLIVTRLDGAGGPAMWSQVAHRGHDELDPAHAVNTAFLTLQLGRALGAAEEVRLDLGMAALLHDMGIASLPAAQRAAERTIVVDRPRPRHTVEGAYLLRRGGGRESLPMIVAIEHHEVSGGAGAAILPHSRLVALTDHLDALTCGRAPGLRRASIGGLLTSLLAGEGPAFDPVHVRLLGRVLRDAAAGGADIATGG